jgi:hypothetical protein
MVLLIAVVVVMRRMMEGRVVYPNMAIYPRLVVE